MRNEDALVQKIKARKLQSPTGKVLFLGSVTSTAEFMIEQNIGSAALYTQEHNFKKALLQAILLFEISRSTNSRRFILRRYLF